MLIRGGLKPNKSHIPARHYDSRVYSSTYVGVYKIILEQAYTAFILYMYCDYTHYCIHIDCEVVTFSLFCSQTKNFYDASMQARLKDMPEKKPLKLDQMTFYLDGFESAFKEWKDDEDFYLNLCCICSSFLYTNDLTNDEYFCLKCRINFHVKLKVLVLLWLHIHDCKRNTRNA